MGKLILFDIDGTLRDEVLGIPPSIHKVLEELRNRHHKVAICTGRSIGTIQEDVLQLEIENIIAGGGSYISHNGRVIRDSGFSKEIMRLLWRCLMKSKDEIGCVFEGNYEIYMNGIAVEILANMNSEKSKSFTKEQRYNFLKNEKIMYRDNLDEFLPDRIKIHKVSLWCSREEFCRIAHILGEENIELAQQGAHGKYKYYEIVKKDTGKGSAVRRLCECLGVETEDTVAFGDGMNDIDMLKSCNVKIAMENGAEELFPYADSICKRPMEDGIYLELKRRGLIGNAGKAHTRR